MCSRQTILWLLWLAAVVAVLWFFAHQARAATQGSAAADQLRLAKRSFVKAKAVSAMPALPKLVIPPKPNLYFTATCTSTNGLESDFCNEVFTNQSPVTLAWDRSTSLGITNYSVYMGKTSRVYTVKYSAGTNLTLKVPPSPPTNVVITVSGLGTNWTGTNPTGMRWFRGTNMTISKRYQ